MTNNLKHIIMPDGTKLDLPTGSSGGPSKIGDIGFAPYVDETTNERRRLNGQVLIKDQYPAFVSWLTGLQTTTPSLFTTEDNWQAIKTASNFGVVNKFVIGDTTVRLPNYPDYIIAGADKVKGNGLTLGLTDGTNTGGLVQASQNVVRLVALSQLGSVGDDRVGDDLSYNKFLGLTTDPTKSGIITNQEKIAGYYYITVNTGSETTKPTINDYTVTTAYQYGMSQYYKGTMNSGVWLRSNGQWNPKATYEGLYNWALSQLNAGVEGFKGSTASDITDYDFVINQTDETFRLPLKNGMEGVFASRAKGDGKTVGFTDGTNNYGLGDDSEGYLKLFTGSYNTNVGSAFTTGSSSNINKSVGLTTDSTKSGIVVDTTVPSGYNLYYYCGNVEENLQSVNVARIEEALVDKTSMAQASIASIPSDKYEDLTLLASEQPYTAPENGYFYLSKAGSNGQYISILNPSTGISLYSEKYSNGSPRVLYRVKKGDEVTITYTTTGTTNYFRFYYDIGAASSVSPDKAIANHLDTINGEVV